MKFFPRPVEILNAAIGTAGLQVTRGLVYGAHLRQRMDIYRPAGVGGGLPVIMFFYGGSWSFGDRGEYAFIAALLARRGFAVVVPDYRLSPEVGYPAFIEDCAAATRLAMRELAAQELFLMGHSAGAYNAVMLGLAPFYLEDIKVAGVIGLAGPYDFLPLRWPNMIRVFSTAADLLETQPVTHVKPDGPPMFLATGAQDMTVLPRNTTKLAAQLRAAGGAVEVRIYPRLGHIGIITAMLPVLSWRAPVLADSLGFIERCRNGVFEPARSATAQQVIG